MMIKFINKIYIIVTTKRMMSSAQSKHRQSISTTSQPKSTSKSYQLDLEYLQLRDQIVTCRYYQYLTKNVKIKLNLWLDVLDKVIVNNVWKKNRNNHAKLINLMCQCDMILRPYNLAPPKNGMPNLSKHQVNAIIDNVQRTVKMNDHLNKKQSRTSVTVVETPEEHWNKVRHMRGNSQTSMSEDSSSFICRFMDIVQRSNQTSHINQGKFEPGKESDLNLSVEKENNGGNEPGDVKTVKKQRGKIKIEHESSQKRKLFSKVRSRYIDLRASRQSNTQTYFPNNTRIDSQPEEGQQPPPIKRDLHQSIQIANQTLRTNSFNQLSFCQIAPDEVEQVAGTDRSEYNFHEDLSERCPERNCMGKQFFNMKKLPSLQVQLHQSSHNASNTAQEHIDELEPVQVAERVDQEIKSTQIQSEQSLGKINSAHLAGQEHRYYWEQNFESCDTFEYIEARQNISLESSIADEQPPNFVLREITQDVLN